MDHIYSQGSGGGRNVNSYNANSYNNVNSYNNHIVHNTIADDKPQILKWLSPLEPQKRHQQICDNRHEGVGEWIFGRDEFVKWRMEEDGSHPVIFCDGDPGVGKTHLSSLVMDRLQDEAVRSRRNVKIIGLYCDYLDRKEQTVRNLLGALLKQVVCIGNIPEDIRQVFEAAKGYLGGTGPRLSQLREMLKTAIASREQVLVCIDAIDEASPEHRVDLLDALRETSRESPSVRIFLTGRPFVRSEVEKYFPGVQVISVSPTTDDIKRYLTMKLEKDTVHDAMDDRLREDILRIIPQKISEIFLLVSLSIETILGETTISKRRKRLDEMTKRQNVGDVYTATLERIKAQMGSKSRLAMDALMWISHSECPLGPDELHEALGVELATPDLDIDNVPSIQTIVKCSLGLITVDSLSSTVRLVHFTLQEYLHANPTLFHSPHSMMAEVCLTYLNFDSIRNLPPTLCDAPSTTPFLGYASCHWGTHARMETTESIIPLALKLLNEFDDHISSKLLILYTEFVYKDFPEHLLDEEGSPEGFTGLHGASYFGVEEIILALLQIMEWDINATDRSGNTALGWAVAEGHDGLVKMLLERNDLDPNIANLGQQTPLLQAAKQRYEQAVKLLLERSDVNPNTADACGRTPLSWAAEYRWEGVVMMLLSRSDVNPETADNGGRTPLSRAAEFGGTGVVKMLLDRSDVNPDMADKGGRTPLSWATRYMDAGVVVMLLFRSDVNPETADNGGRTPLSWAAEYGRGEAVMMLLNRHDINPDMADKTGRTPLSWAAQKGKDDIVIILLNRGDVNPETADNGGRTPLSWAARFGYAGVAMTLLSRSDVNPETADNGGRTSLSWAAQKGKDDIVMMLLNRSDVNPETADNGGRTPLSWAAQKGKDHIVMMLLNRSDVNPDMADKSGQTPLSYAARNRRARVTGMLFERIYPNPTCVDAEAPDPPEPIFTSSPNPLPNGSVSFDLPHRN